MFMGMVMPAIALQRYWILRGDIMTREISAEEVIRDFNKGLENHEIYMCYQPQYNHSTGRMIGAEAI